MTTFDWHSHLTWLRIGIASVWLTFGLLFKAIGTWMLVGRLLWACALAQTLVILAMNALELRRARDLLLAPIAMVCANVVFLSLGWYVALES